MKIKVIFIISFGDLLYDDITDYTSGFICEKNLLKLFFKRLLQTICRHDCKLQKQKLKIIEIPFKDELRASGTKTLVTVNLKYIYMF